MAARKAKPSMRSIVVDVPEAEMMKLVKLAQAEGISTHDLASRKFTDLLRGIE